MPNIFLKEIIEGKNLEERLRQITYRGVFDSNGDTLKPYEHAKFSLVDINPPAGICELPKFIKGGQEETLYTAQPTIYENQIEIFKDIDNFLKKNNKDITKLNFEAINYDWEGRGNFHFLPPIIERHIYPLKNGTINTKELYRRFKGCYVKDYKGNLHDLSKGLLKDFYIDELSCLDDTKVFYSHASLLNYGRRLDCNFKFNIVCDGSHRLDYSFEYLNKSMTAIYVQSNNGLLPYYALPMTFRPSLRVSSKTAEKMFPKLDRDKIHLLNDYIKKTLHYNWESAGLSVSKLRSNA